MEQQTFNPCDLVITAVQARPMDALHTARSLAQKLFTYTPPPGEDPVWVAGACLLLSFVITHKALSDPTNCNLSDAHATVRDLDRLLSSCSEIIEANPNHRYSTTITSDLIGVAKWIATNAEYKTKLMLAITNLATVYTLPFAPSTRIADLTRASNFEFHTPRQIREWKKVISSIDTSAVPICVHAAETQIKWRTTSSEITFE